jgi:hypothetical protein
MFQTVIARLAQATQLRCTQQWVRTPSCAHPRKVQQARARAAIKQVSNLGGNQGNDEGEGEPHTVLLDRGRVGHLL